MAIASRAASGSTPSVVASRISFGYNRNQMVVSDWSAEFLAGSMSALTGGSGRGKSTILYLLGLMTRPQSGGVLINGELMSSASDAARAEMRARQFGFVFQDAALDPSRSVLDNVLETTLYRGESRAEQRHKALSLMEKFGVDLPPSRKPGQISGGQAQRIALCRALLADPAVLFADEPTGNLDHESSGLVLRALREHANQGGTVIVVTHSSELAAECDNELRI